MARFGWKSFFLAVGVLLAILGIIGLRSIGVLQRVQISEREMGPYALLGGDPARVAEIGKIKGGDLPSKRMYWSADLEVLVGDAQARTAQSGFLIPYADFELLRKKGQKIKAEKFPRQKCLVAEMPAGGNAVMPVAMFKIPRALKEHAERQGLSGGPAFIIFDLQGEKGSAVIGILPLKR